MSETWVSFVDEDVFAKKAPERLTVVAIKRRDDLADICGQVASQIRQAYAFSNRDLGDDGTIPDGLKARAIAIALWRFVTEGMPKNPALQTRERGDAYTEATKFLEQISSAEIGKVSAPAVGTKHRRFRHSDEDGV